MSVLAFGRRSKVEALLASNGDDSAPVSQASLNAFGNAVITVTAYCNAVRFTTLAPVSPGNEPAWFATLDANLTNMKTHAQAWIDQIGPSMTAIPQAIINFDNSFEGQYATIMALLTQIGGGTPTPQQKKDLLTEMNALLSALGTQQQSILDANTRLIQFNDNLSADHQALTTGASSITNAITSDKNDVVMMNQAIKNLNLDIQMYNQIVTWSAIGLVLSVFACIVGIVLAVATFGAGVVVIVGAAIGAGASIAGLAVAETKIKEDTQNIQKAQQELSDDNQQIVVLNSVANAVDGLVQKNAAAGKSMETVLSDWATLMVKMKAVIDDLDQSEGDIGSVLDTGDMVTTRSAWQQLAAFAGNMQSSLGGITAEAPVKVSTAA